MDDLKECPCCNGKAEITKGYTSTFDTWPQGNFYRVFCGACQLRQLFHESPEAAAKAWNRRAVPQANAEQDALLVKAEDKGYFSGVRVGLLQGASIIREVYVNHVHHTGLNGLKQRCEEAEQVLYRKVEESDAASKTTPSSGEGE